MPQVPLSLLEWLCRRRLWTRPDLLAAEVADSPEDDELVAGVLFLERRDGHPKWVHFRCPACPERIQVPVAGSNGWKMSVDWLRRPSLAPSVWQTGGCGAHFFVQRGRIVWAQPIGGRQTRVANR